MAPQEERVLKVCKDGKRKLICNEKKWRSGEGFTNWMKRIMFPLGEIGRLEGSLLSLGNV